MATATQTSTAFASAPRAYVAAPTTKTVTFNFATAPGAPTASGASTVLLAKIPFGCTITDIVGRTSSGAATAPVDIGISGNNLSTFVTAAASGSVFRATKGIPYRVTGSDDATVEYQILTATVTPGTNTTAVELNVTVSYTADE